MESKRAKAVAAAALTVLSLAGCSNMDEAQQRMVSGGAIGGIDALYSTVQMPRGIPVATVAIDGAVNAALLAVEILAIADEQLADRLVAHRA